MVDRPGGQVQGDGQQRGDAPVEIGIGVAVDADRRGATCRTAGGRRQFHRAAGRQDRLPLAQDVVESLPGRGIDAGRLPGGKSGIEEMIGVGQITGTRFDHPDPGGESSMLTARPGAACATVSTVEAASGADPAIAIASSTVSARSRIALATRCTGTPEPPSLW